MGEIESDKESFYSADSLESLGGKNNFMVKKDCKDGLVTVPFYEGEVSVSLNCINNITKNSIKKKLIKNKTTNSNISRYSSNFLRLNLQSVRTTEKTEEIVSKCSSPSVYSRSLSSARTNSKIVNSSASIIRPRNRSLSYLEQYQKKLSSSCNRNTLHNSTTTINSIPNVSEQGDYLTPSLNSSNLSEKEVNNPNIKVKHSQLSNSISSSNAKKQQSNYLNHSREIKCNDMRMKLDVQDDKLASLKKRKEYGDVIKKKNQEELLIQKTQSKNKIRGRSTEKSTGNYNLSNHKVETLPLSLIEKRKAFSEKVKQKNRVEFMCQKIEEKSLRRKNSSEYLRENEDCFTQKIKSTLNADKPSEKQNALMKSKRKVDAEKKEGKQMHHNEDVTDLEVLQRRHEQDKIKARNIRNEFLKT